MNLRNPRKLKLFVRCNISNRFSLLGCLLVVIGVSVCVFEAVGLVRSLSDFQGVLIALSGMTLLVGTNFARSTYKAYLETKRSMRSKLVVCKIRVCKHKDTYCRRVGSRMYQREVSA